MRKSNFLLVTVIAVGAMLAVIPTMVVIRQAFALIPPITLGNPYFVEYDKTTSQKPVVINGTTNATQRTAWIG